MQRRLRNLTFFLLMVVSLALWWRPLGGTFRLAFGNDAYTHILLILPMSCALIYVDRDRLRISSKQDFITGSAMLVGALLIAAFSKWGSGLTSDIRLSLSMLGLVTWWIGVLIFCFGARAVRSLVFPVGFLLLIVPLPESTVTWIIEFLQQQSAIAARIMFRAAGVPVTQDGIMLSIPGLDIEVARECSSIRSSLILVITTMVLAHLLLRSLWRKILLVAIAIPLSFVKNGFRIFVISELGRRVDPSFFDGRLHHQGGIVFLTIALGAVVALLWVLRRTEAPNPKNLVLSTARE